MDTLILLILFLARSAANFTSWLPFVVIVISSRFVLPIFSDRFSISHIKFFLTRGSPPVSRIFVIPQSINIDASLYNSSKVKRLVFGKKVMFSDMQYTHLKSQRSVTDILRYVISLSKGSISCLPVLRFADFSNIM